MNSYKKKPLIFNSLLVFLIFIIAGILTYFNALSNPFHYDDLHHITLNPHIRNISRIPSLFTDTGTFSSVIESKGGGFHYRPLVMLTYTLNYAAGELNPIGWHLVNLAFHVGSAFLVFLIVNAMLEDSKQLEDKSAPYFAAIAAGLIFLVHPFNSEIVNYISTRSSVMSGFFYLLGFYCWIKYRSKKLEVRSKKQEVRKNLVSNLLFLTSDFLPLTSIFYLASLLAFAAGMLSKEVAITLPAMFWLYDMYGFSKVSSQQSAVSSQKQEVRFPLFNVRVYIPYLPFILLVIVPYLAIRASWLGTTLSNSKRDMWSQIFTELPVLVKHWKMFLMPTNLTVVHETEIFKSFFSFPVIYSLFALIVYIIVTILLFYTASRLWRVVSFFMLWFFVVVLPTAIVPLNLIFQEHRGYLAIVSFVVIAGVILQELKNSKVKDMAVLVLVILLGIYATSTVYRNKVWKDGLTLWADTLTKSPRSTIPYVGIGWAYYNIGKYDRAINAFRKAIYLDGGGDEILTAHQNLGRVYIVMKKWDIAISTFQNALRIYPNDLQMHNDLGIVYFEIGKEDLAASHFVIGSKIAPFDSLSFFNLGALLAKQGKLEKSLEVYTIALKLSPDNLELRFRIGTLLEALEKPEEAVDMYKYIVHHARAKDAQLMQEAKVHLKKIGL